MKETVEAWWRQLAVRERRLIGWGGAGLVLALAYAYVWLPVDAERHKLRAGLPATRAAAARMQDQVDEARGLRRAAQAGPVGGALRSAVQAAATEAGIGKDLRLDLIDDNHANASWTSISFDAWLGLAASLQESARVRVESVTIDAAQEPGMVRVQAVFASGG